MSLATRCTACGTIFRIVEDQLRVSDGWVRCGRCAEVFDARELLFDIDRDAPPSWGSNFGARVTEEAPPSPPPPAPIPAPPPPRPAPPPPAEAAPLHREPMFDEPTWTSPPPFEAEPPEPATGPDIVIGEPAAPAADERPEPRWNDDLTPPQAAAPARIVEPRSETLLPPPPPLVPEFMKRAERGTLWQRPAVRAALAGGLLLLAAALAFQITLHFRNALAARSPGLLPALQSLCRISGCEIKPWQRTDALTIDSTSLTPISSSNHYRLNLSLRNKSGTEVAAPWIDLTLSDASGTPFARRVFAPEALSPALDRLRADADQALSLSFGTGQQRVSGYKVDIFYP